VGALRGEVSLSRTCGHSRRRAPGAKSVPIDSVGGAPEPRPATQLAIFNLFDLVFAARRGSMVAVGFSVAARASCGLVRTTGLGAGWAPACVWLDLGGSCVQSGCVGGAL